MKKNALPIFLVLLSVLIGAAGYFFFTNVFIPHLM